MDSGSRARDDGAFLWQGFDRRRISRSRERLQPVTRARKSVIRAATGPSSSGAWPWPSTSKDSSLGWGRAHGGDRLAAQKVRTGAADDQHRRGDQARKGGRKVDRRRIRLDLAEAGGDVGIIVGNGQTVLVGKDQMRLPQPVVRAEGGEFVAERFGELVGRIAPACGRARLAEPRADASEAGRGRSRCQCR